MKATPSALSKVYFEDGSKKNSINFGDVKKQLASIRTSVNRLLVAYSFAAKVNGATFAEDYATRSMATMEDVLGTSDLDFGEDKMRVPTWKTVRNYGIGAKLGVLVANTAHSVAEWGTSVGGIVGTAVGNFASLLSRNDYAWKKIRIYKMLEYWKANVGKEGFHSRAIAPVDDISVLVEPRVKTILGLNRESKVLEKVDTRKEKREAVLAYMNDVDQMLTTGER